MHRPGLPSRQMLSEVQVSARALHDALGADVREHALEGLRAARSAMWAPTSRRAMRAHHQMLVKAVSELLLPWKAGCWPRLTIATIDRRCPWRARTYDSSSTRSGNLAEGE
jgi:hypothetical protein